MSENFRHIVYLRSIFVHLPLSVHVNATDRLVTYEALVKVIRDAFRTATQALCALRLVCDWLAFDLVSFAFSTFLVSVVTKARSETRRARKEPLTSSNHPGWRGTASPILMVAILTWSFMRMSISITHQRCKGNFG